MSRDFITLITEFRSLINLNELAYVIISKVKQIVKSHFTESENTLSTFRNL